MSQHGSITPPAWPVKLLRYFIRAEYLEEIEGDMEEIFFDNVENMPLAKAKRRYAWEMVKLLRPSLIKNMEFTQNFKQYNMITNYSKTSFRNLMKNPLSSFINIFGLAMAIGVTMVVYAFIAFDLNTDTFHENQNEVFLATYNADQEGRLQQYGLSPLPLGEALQADFPQVQKMCRIERKSVVLKYGEKVFYEHIKFVDAEYLEMFTFPLKWGVAGSLNDINTIILSEEMSIKYFGQENPIGQDLLIVFREDYSKVFTVGGVAEAFPRAHDISFNFLINFESLKTAVPNKDWSDWSQQIDATLVQVDDPADITILQDKMEKYKELQNEAEHERPIVSFQFEQLAGLHSKRAGEIRSAISNGYPPEGRVLMPLFAIFLLTMACLNYINIAIVSASKRLKEIALRKVIGANRVSVVVQFLAENIIITSFALAIGLGLGAFVFTPWFNNQFQQNIAVEFIDPNLWIFLVSLLLFTGVASGIYPALYISRFQVVNIFGGSLKFGKKNVLTKVFLVVQLAIACVNIICAVMFTKNTYYMADRDWGYDQESIVYVQAPTADTYKRLRNEMASYPDIISMSGAKHHIGRGNQLAVIHRPEKDYEAKQFAVDAYYLDNMGITVKSGRQFAPDSEFDREKIIVNETLVKNLMIENPLGELLELDSSKYEIIAVVEDFHASNFDYRIKPMIFRLAAEEDHKFLAMKVMEDKEQEALDHAKAKWAELYPEIPFLGGHQQDVWYWYFNYIDSTANFMGALAFMSILLTCLGLYGLVTLNVSGRVREFSVRKILGARLSHIASSVSKQYLLLLCLALMIGVPLGYMAVNALFETIFSYYVTVGHGSILLSVSMLVVVVALVIFTQVSKVSRSNPVDGLKVE